MEYEFFKNKYFVDPFWSVVCTVNLLNILILSYVVANKLGDFLHKDDTK